VIVIGKNSLLVLEKLKETIFSKEIILKYRNNKTDFTRNRKQPFGQMLLFMFNLVKKTLVIEIDNFVEFLNSKIDSQEVKDFTKSAFVQKRMKINPEVFKHLSEVIVENTYVESNPTINLFEGFRLLAVDGSKVTLPFTEDLKKESGVLDGQIYIQNGVVIGAMIIKDNVSDKDAKSIADNYAKKLKKTYKDMKVNVQAVRGGKNIVNIILDK